MNPTFVGTKIGRFVLGGGCYAVRGWVTCAPKRLAGTRALSPGRREGGREWGRRGGTEVTSGAVQVEKPSGLQNREGSKNGSVLPSLFSTGTIGSQQKTRSFDYRR